MPSRWLRIITCSFFFFLYLWHSKTKDKYVFTAFLLFLLSDVMMLEYEVPGAKKLTFGLVIFAYARLMLHIIPQLTGLKANFFQKLLFVSVLGINIAMLYFLVDMVEYKIDYPYHSALFYLYGLSMIGLLILAFSYINRHSNKASFYFICAVMGFVFSDITGFIAYYLEVGEFYYLDRMFYLIELVSLVKFSGLDMSEGSLQAEML